MTEAARVLAHRVKQLRRARRLSVAELGDAVGISDEWIRRIERGTGKPSLETIEAISHALDTPIAALFIVDDGDERFERLRSMTEKLSEKEMSWLIELCEVLIRKPDPRAKSGNE